MIVIFAKKIVPDNYRERMTIFNQKIGFSFMVSCFIYIIFLANYSN